MSLIIYVEIEGHMIAQNDGLNEAYKNIFFRKSFSSLIPKNGLKMAPKGEFLGCHYLTAGPIFMEFCVFVKLLVHF